MLSPCRRKKEKADTVDARRAVLSPSKEHEEKEELKMINLGHYTTAWNDGEIVYDCAFCSKGCNSFSSLVQHCKMTTLHAWCHQCERAFPSESAKEDHRKNSSRHYFCTICNTSGEYASYTELREHKIDQHNWCYTCDQYFPDFWTLRTHDYDRHYMCPNCDEFCGDSDGLRTVTIRPFTLLPAVFFYPSSPGQSPVYSH